MADTLLQALVSRFHRDNVLKTVFDVGADACPWVTEAPEQSTLPLCTIEHGGEVPDYTFELAYKTDGEITFRVYAEGLAAVEALAANVMDCYDRLMDDPQELVITGARCTGCYRNNYTVRREPERSPTGDWVYSVELPYSFKIRRTLRGAV